MDKNLHNIDDLFSKAYNSFEEHPTDAVWEKLSTALDKDDAEKYKKRFIGWKRIAVILLLMLSGLIIYESHIITKRKKDIAITKKKLFADSLHSEKNSQVDIRTKNYKNSLQEKSSLNESARSNDIEKRNTIKKSKEENQSSVQLNYPQKQEDQSIGLLAEKKPSLKKNEYPVVKKQQLTFKRSRGDLKKNNTENVSTIVNTDKEEFKITNTQGPKDNEILIKRIPVIPAEPLKRKGDDLNSFAALMLLQSVLELNQNLTAGADGHPPLNNKKTFRPYWSLTAFGSNDWGQYTLNNDVQDNNSSQQGEDDKEEIYSREKDDISFSAGVVATRQFRSRLGLKTGLIFSNTSININPQAMYASKKPDGNIAYKYITSSGYGFVNPEFGLPPSVGDSIWSSEAQLNMQTLSIPVLLSYKMNMKKFSLAPSAGITVNFILNTKLKTEVTDALNRESVIISGLNGMRNVYAGLMTELNLQYTLNKSWSFNFLPGFRHALTPITRNYIVKTYPYSFTIGAGITYKF